jgi:hypothetical protein
VVLIFQNFFSRAGEEERALTALRERAATMIRNAQADAVLVCQHADLLHRLLWIQHQARPRVAAMDAGEPLPLEPGLVECDGAPAHVEYIDGTYQFPLPPCRVWRVETCDEKVARTLLNLSRLASSNRGICGVSIYRMAEDPSRKIGFLALVPEVAPGDYLPLAGRPDTALTLYPLRVRWTIGRLMPGTTPSPPLVRYPLAAFWARLGIVADIQERDRHGGTDQGGQRQSVEPATTTIGAAHAVTCGQCGQTWQRAAGVDGQPIECIFCGYRGCLARRGRPDAAPSAGARVNTWLLR